jgi:hypothetical protein
MSLKQFVLEQAITTYDQLIERCKNLGVIAPMLSEFQTIMPEPITDQSEGIIVLEPPKTFMLCQHECVEENSSSNVIVEDEKPLKKRKKTRDIS